MERFVFFNGKTRGARCNAARPKTSGKTAFFPRSDRSYGLEREAFQTQKALDRSKRPQDGRGMEDKAPLPLVSVIVPVYNTARYLEQCLSSLCSQTLHDIEIVCINDGSTDASETIIKDFCVRDPRVRLVSQKNAGVCEARKNGMRLARGRYIGFVDSDDYVDSDFYELLYAAALKEQADIVATSAIFPFLDDGKILPQKMSAIIRDTPSLTPEERARMFLGTTVGCNKLYTADICRKAASFYLSEENRAEDNAFTISALILADKVTVITAPRYFYRQHGASICHQTISLPAMLRIYAMYCRLLEDVENLSLSPADLRIYKRYILRRRNWDCFQIAEQLPGLTERLAFVRQTRDAGFQFSWLLRKLRRTWRNVIKGW